MNKDVIYIETGDDITDIIAKIENSKERIVAIVPPKKAEVFRSIVNIKLIAKAGAKTEKTVVFVTVDPAILKLAAATKTLATKDLQTAPTIPNVDELKELDVVSEEIVDEEARAEKTENKEEGEEQKEDKGSEEKEDDKNKKEKSKKEDKDSTVKGWFEKYKKMLIFGGVTAAVLVVFVVWAFVIAPSATVTIEVRTTKNNFSEGISFTSVLTEENASQGKFYLDEKKNETVEEKTITATGKKNVGEKASGEVVVYAFFKDKGSKTINAGNVFTINDMSFISSEDVVLSWDGKDLDACANKNSGSQVTNYGCQVIDRVGVVASEPGEKYNIAASTSGWNDTGKTVEVYSDSEMSGGTDKNVTVILQADIDKVTEKVKSETEKSDAETLAKLIDDSSLAITDSFKTEITKVVASPGVGEEVKDSEKPSVKITVTSKVYILDKTKIEEFISSKAKLSDGYRIYSIDDPFVENFSSTAAGYVGKLKTSYTVGAKITEKDIVDKIRGKGLGDAQHDLKNIEGISSVRIDTSFPWVNAIPSDTNKIFINLEIKQ